MTRHPVPSNQAVAFIHANSIKSAAGYFGGEDNPMPFVEIVAINSGQSPALGFVWAPEFRYFADVEADIVSDLGEEWMEQPGHLFGQRSNPIVCSNRIQSG